MTSLIHMQWERAAYDIALAARKSCLFQNITTESACSFLCEGGNQIRLVTVTKWIWQAIFCTHNQRFGKSYQASKSYHRLPGNVIDWLIVWLPLKLNCWFARVDRFQYLAMAAEFFLFQNHVCVFPEAAISGAYTALFIDWGASLTGLPLPHVVRFISGDSERWLTDRQAKSCSSWILAGQQFTWSW